MRQSVQCGKCGQEFPPAVLALAHQYAFWRRADGACPACVQETLLRDLLARGEAEFASAVQHRWPIDPEAAFGALPTPLRLRADPRFSGGGVTIAIADAGFTAHPDLITPSNRILAWVDATRSPLVVRRFGTTEMPEWPGSTDSANHQWHGTMTSVVAAGNGYLSQGLYRGIASQASIVLIHLTDQDGRITDQSILRALTWLEEHGAALGVSIVSLSIAGDQPSEAAQSPIERACERLVRSGMTIVAAAGNDGERRLVPPASSPSVVTVGGLDDRNLVDRAAAELWHSNYGDSASGFPKPEVVAPSLWVAAPVLVGSALAAEAEALFRRRSPGVDTGERRIGELKLITRHYQHVDGTSFAAPIVAATAAAMLEANPRLTPALIKELLVRSAHLVPGAPPERQGAGAVDSGRAVALAGIERHGWSGPEPTTPLITATGPVFRIHDHRATRVDVYGSWDGWAAALPGRQAEPGLWTTHPAPLGPGDYQYKLKIDDLWLADPANPWRAIDGLGGVNSRFRWPA